VPSASVVISDFSLHANDGHKVSQSGSGLILPPGTGHGQASWWPKLAIDFASEDPSCRRNRQECHADEW